MLPLGGHAFLALLLSFADESRARGQLSVLRLLPTALSSVVTLAISMLSVYYLDLTLEFFAALQGEEPLLASLGGLRVV